MPAQVATVHWPGPLPGPSATCSVARCRARHGQRARRRPLAVDACPPRRRGWIRRSSPAPRPPAPLVTSFPPLISSSSLSLSELQAARELHRRLVVVHAHSGLPAAHCWCLGAPPTSATSSTLSGSSWYKPLDAGSPSSSASGPRRSSTSFSCNLRTLPRAAVVPGFRRR